MISSSLYRLLATSLVSYVTMLPIALISSSPYGSGAASLSSKHLPYHFVDFLHTAQLSSACNGVQTTNSVIYISCDSLLCLLSVELLYRFVYSTLFSETYLSVSSILPL